jgi:hypothetical protein
MAAHHRDKKLTTTETLNFTGCFYANVMFMYMKITKKLCKRLLFLKYEFSDIKYGTQKAGWSS